MKLIAVAATFMLRSQQETQASRKIHSKACGYHDACILFTVHYSRSYFLHVSPTPQCLQTTSIVLVLRPAGALCDVFQLSIPQLGDDFIDILRLRIDRERARVATQRAIALTIAVIVI